MIGNINYSDYQTLTNELNNSKEKIKSLISLYSTQQDDNITREMNEFILNLDNYINYLKNILKMNIDADKFIQENSN